MIDKVNDIKRALESKAYLAALSLALTLPDICGKVAYPTMRVGARYAKWFEDYISQFYNPPIDEYTPKFTGEMCYKLRCAYLHAGNTEGIPIDHFNLCIDGCDCFGSTWSNENEKECHISINVEGLCLAICNAAEQFYAQNIGKLNFSDTHISIINIREECEKIEKMNSSQQLRED